MLQTSRPFFSLRVMASSGAGPFLDGFSTSSAAFLISLIDGITSLQVAFFTSLYLAGSFVGAMAFGALADHVGRRPPYVAGMALVCIALVLGAATPAIACLLVMRLVLGVCLGGDYPVGQAIVYEKLSPRWRNTALSVLMLAWYLGALAGVCASIPAVRGEMSWQGILYIQTALAVVALFLRFGVGESEVWLQSTSDKAEKSFELNPINAMVCWCANVNAAIAENRKEFFFCAAFWLCQTVPATIMMLYSPSILRQMTGSDDAIVQMLLLYGFFLVGVLPASCAFFASRPKAVLVGTFAVMAAGLLGVVCFAKSCPWLGNVSFMLFAAAYGLQAPLDFIYPNQLFPTKARGSLVGAVTAVSRLGSTGAAFFFPLLEPHFDLTVLFGAGLLVLALGLVVAVKFAPSDAQ